jgi:hypothetical protein
VHSAAKTIMAAILGPYGRLTKGQFHRDFPQNLMA